MAVQVYGANCPKCEATFLGAAGPNWVVLEQAPAPPGSVPIMLVCHQCQTALGSYLVPVAR